MPIVVRYDPLGLAAGIANDVGTFRRDQVYFDQAQQQRAAALRDQQFAEQQRQFDQEFQQRVQQTAMDERFRQAQFADQTNYRQATLSEQQRQFDQETQLSRQRFAQQQRQNDAELFLRQQQLQQQRDDQQRDDAIRIRALIENTRLRGEEGQLRRETLESQERRAADVQAGQDRRLGVREEGQNQRQAVGEAGRDARQQINIAHRERIAAAQNQRYQQRTEIMRERAELDRINSELRRAGLDETVRRNLAAEEARRRQSLLAIHQRQMTDLAREITTMEVYGGDRETIGKLKDEYAEIAASAESIAKDPLRNAIPAPATQPTTQPSPAQPPAQRGYTLGQVIQTPDGRSARIVGFDTDGTPLVQPIGG